MRLTIPNSGTVDSAFHTLERRLKNVRKRINAQAARQMKSGDYDAAQKWMDVGSAVADFTGRVEAFGQEWKRLTKATRIATVAQSPSKAAVKRRSAKTPAWKFCTPALEVLVSKGGAATREDVLGGLEQTMTTILTEKDREAKPPRNAPRWHGTVKKAYRQCQAEGWIEKRTDGVWKITAKGRAVIAQEPTGTTPLARA